MSVPDSFDSDLPRPLPPPLPRRGRADEVQLKGVPFVLRGDERILVRGGFGGTFAWVWTCTVLPMTLCCWSPLVLVEALRGGPAAKLVLAVPEDHALSRALKETERVPKRKGAAPPKLHPAEWTVSGRVLDGAEARGTSRVAAEQLREYVSRDLGADPAAMGVLMVGDTPTQLRASWYLPYGLAGLFGGAGVLLAGVLLRALLVGRWDRY